MEVELQEREVPAFQGDRTPLGHVDLDGVPVVRHVRFRGLPFDVQGSRARQDRARQIYRRLLYTFGTNREGRIQLAPSRSTRLAVIGPVNLAASGLGRVLCDRLFLCVRVLWSARLAGLLCAGEADHRQAADQPPGE